MDFVCGGYVMVDFGMYGQKMDLEYEGGMW